MKNKLINIKTGATNKIICKLEPTAISRATDEDELEIMMGAPAEHVSGLREVFKQQLLDKEIEFKYKAEKRKIKIKKIGVIGEGFASYFTLPSAVRNVNGNLGIIDIGGRTINIATFINGKQDKVCTLNFGIIDLKNNLLKELKKAGKDYDINTIENLLANGKLNIEEKEKETLIKKIINDTKLYKIDINLYSWFIIGGGAIDIGNILDNYFGKDSIVKDALYTNVLGYYNFMIAKWGV
ncbi:hypothetical protein [uncultured Clostridium sp.]|uniref:hypothetical protein n=1 Tax=uncultured Clostridium sp. TaxID=59620 RepID=UPI0025ECF585|nr:hypothetical protein [uncultured Clostridium sp.]